MVSLVAKSFVRLISLPHWKLLGIVFCIQIAIHAPFLQTPATGHHVWRQCNSLALARNFSEEGMNLLEPRIDKRYNTPGITGPAFPAYEYGLALGYKIFGFSQTLHRWWSLIIGLFALAGVYFLALFYTTHKGFAFFAAIALMAIPEFYYHSINAVPDLMAMAFMVWAWYLGLKFVSSENWKYAIGTTLLMSLAGLTKLQFLLGGVPLAVFVFQKNGWRFVFTTRLMFGIAMVVIVANIWWQKTAAALTARYGLWEFLTEIRPANSLKELASILGQNVISDLPETWVGYPILPILLLGLVVAFRKFSLLSICTFGAAVAYYIVLQRQFTVHGYYALVFAPFIALLVALGLRHLRTTLLPWMLILVLLSPAWAAIRESHNWLPAGYRVPAVFLDKKAQLAVLNATDTSMRYIVGPDESGCVYFYYLHAKGYPWYQPADSTQFDEFVSKGARGFITNQPDLLKTQASHFHLKETGRVGDFVWYTIQP